MTAPNSPIEHEEHDFFEETERELVKLTTATLEEGKKPGKPVATPEQRPAPSLSNPTL